MLRASLELKFVSQHICISEGGLVREEKREESGDISVVTVQP